MKPYLKSVEKFNLPIRLFRATIVQAYAVIWKNVESEYLSVDYTAPSTSPSDVTTISHPISTTSEVEAYLKKFFLYLFQLMYVT